MCHPDTGLCLSPFGHFLTFQSARACVLGFWLLSTAISGGQKVQRGLELACLELGLPLKEDKVVGPTTTLEFLGIMIDSDKMEVRLPEDKVVQLGLLSDQKPSCRKRDCEQTCTCVQDHSCSL